MKTLKLKDTGSEVRRLQELLLKQGVNIPSTGIYDETTKDAVTAFQRKNRLCDDGIVGYRTWEALFVANHTPSARLTDAEFELVAELLEVEVAALKAVQQVETGGKGGFFGNGQPAILFEGHVFWAELVKRGLNPEDYLEGNEDILYSKWDSKRYLGGIREYDRLEKASKINKEAAEASASWGMFQIMGFNHLSCGEKSVESFVAAMKRDEFTQLILAARFIAGNKQMLTSLRKMDWAAFARCYNGPRFAENNYDKKLNDAYNRHKR